MREATICDTTPPSFILTNSAFGTPRRWMPTSTSSAVPACFSTISWEMRITARRTSSAVMMALRHRDLTGQGQVIDMAIIEPILTILGPQPLWYDQFGIVQERRDRLPPVQHTEQEALGETLIVGLVRQYGAYNGQLYDLTADKPAGDARVDPRGAEACRNCGSQALCRIVNDRARHTGKLRDLKDPFNDDKRR